jgi:ferrous iron transport protein B
VIEVALAGNPNTGKTTLFNRLTGARGRVGNFPGITVERRSGERQTPSGRWRIHDLPGCYSLLALSPEEEIAHHVLTGRYGDRAMDCVVVVLDASNLARNLMLLLQIAEYDLPVVGALNMTDHATATGLTLDVAGLEAALGCPMVAMVARTGEGVDELERRIAEVLATPDRGRIAATAWPDNIARVVLALTQQPLLASQSPTAGEALWWLGSADDRVEAALPGATAKVVDVVQAAAAGGGDDGREALRRAVTVARYQRIDALLAEHQHRVVRPATHTERIDSVALHPIAGVVLFLTIMATLFQAVFAGVNPAIDVIDTIMSALAPAIAGWLPDGTFRAVIIDGVLAGVAGTLVFVPQIAVLFLGIAILEDTGYLARTALLMDRLLGRVGLPGTAFVPLLSSFACNVPGIMAARTMQSPSDRLVTILIAPLMSCAARLPVYAMVTAAVFAGTPPILGFLSVGGLLITGMYLLGLLLALIVATVLRRTIARGPRSPLLLELPPYRLPRWRDVVGVVGQRVWRFCRDTGTIIVALTVILWALMSYPSTPLPPAQQATLEAAVAVATDTTSRDRASAALASAQSAHVLEHSAAGRIGHWIEPLIAPLGFDWRIGIGLVGSFAAREVLIPVMGRVYGRGDARTGADADSEAYQDDVGHSMVRISHMTPLVGIALMVFFAVAMQCMSTLAVIVRETGGWKWALFALTYLNVLAWVLAFAARRIGLAFGLS